MMKAYNVEVRISKQEDGLWRAEAPALPGCFVDGETVKDVLRDIQEVAAMAIDFFLEEGRLPSAISEIRPEDSRLHVPVVIEEYRFRRPSRPTRGTAATKDPQSKPRRGKVRVQA